MRSDISRAPPPLAEARRPWSASLVFSHPGDNECGHPDKLFLGFYKWKWQAELACWVEKQRVSCRGCAKMSVVLHTKPAARFLVSMSRDNPNRETWCCRRCECLVIVDLFEGCTFRFKYSMCDACNREYLFSLENRLPVHIIGDCRKCGARGLEPCDAGLHS